jgi:hypothetical protein
MPHAPTAAWLDRFTMRLGQLLPSLTIDEASRIALAHFVDAGALDPVRAAEMYASERAAACLEPVRRRASVR